MKLKNKKTGKIVTAETYRCGGNCSIELVFAEEDQPPCEYNSLAELCEEWEDYEEPKEFYHIGEDGDIKRYPVVVYNDFDLRKLKEIGNYFETKEEAEKAVEKLKAWKRLKDKGFVFKHNEVGSVCTQITEVWARADFSNGMAFLNDTIKADLDLLFGGEE